MRVNGCSQRHHIWRRGTGSFTYRSDLKLVMDVRRCRLLPRDTLWKQWFLEAARGNGLDKLGLESAGFLFDSDAAKPLHFSRPERDWTERVVSGGSELGALSDRSEALLVVSLIRSPEVRTRIEMRFRGPQEVEREESR